MRLGELIAKSRLDAGIRHQSSFAKLLETNQRTISRWENGLSRPTPEQLQNISRILQIELKRLMAVGEYTLPKMALTPFAQSFPIDSLEPESFEKFCYHFLYLLFRTQLANVHRAGNQGHKQDGLDIKVIFPDDKIWTFQCKRVNGFGPEKVEAAVKAHTANATIKHILLSRVASPQAREAIQKHKNWYLWDKDDISTKIRHELPIEAQARLVDIFFPGQKFALLGETKFGPWQTTSEFFAPFKTKTTALSHAWELVGRAQTLTEIRQALVTKEAYLIFLIGSGGIGKSRILKEVVESFEASHSDVLIRFLAPSEALTMQSLLELGPGSKLLVVDDAQDRSDLAPLMQYASDPANSAKVLLATRPYGLDFAKTQAARFALVGQLLKQIRLERLSLDESTKLSQQVLKELGGDISFAQVIARATIDCTLATVLTSQIIANEPQHIELVKNESAFHDTIFGKFQNVLAGTIGEKSDEIAIKKLFRLIALVQPIEENLTSFTMLAEHIENIEQSETKRLFKLISSAGIAFQRGLKFRLSPDMLADFLIEKNCIGIHNSSTGYAEKVMNLATSEQFKNLVMNVTRLDWRLSKIESDDREIIENLWTTLSSSPHHISTIADMAYYQPARALQYAEARIREGSRQRELSTLIKHAGYNLPFLHRACECLWELGKDDSRRLNQFPDHPIRILRELCEPAVNKALDYSRTVVAFAISLLSKDDTWRGSYTPFDFLAGILITEGHETVSTGTSLNFKPFTVPPLVTESLRLQAVNSAIAMLSHPDNCRAIKAAKFIGEALHYPVSSADEPWDAQFIQIISNLSSTLKSQTINPFVHVKILQQIWWHAEEGDRATAPYVKELFDSQPATLEFRIARGLLDSYGDMLRGSDVAEWQTRLASWTASLVEDLIIEFTDATELWKFSQKYIQMLRSCASEERQSIQPFFWRLIEQAPKFADVLLADCLQGNEIAYDLASIALSSKFKQDRNAAEETALQFARSKKLELECSVPQAYLTSQILQDGSTMVDEQIISQLLHSQFERVQQLMISALRISGPKDKRSVIRMVIDVDISRSNRLAEDMIGLIDSVEFTEILSENDVQLFLNKLALVENLDGHWIQKFLSYTSENFPTRTANFLMQRVAYASNQERDRNIRLHNYGSFPRTKLQFVKSAAYPRILGQVSQWLKSNDDVLFRYHGTLLFKSMFAPYDDSALLFLEGWLQICEEKDFELIAKLIALDSKHKLFTDNSLVVSLLNRALEISTGSVDIAIKEIIAAAMSNTKSGPAGQPFPQDIELKEQAETMMTKFSRFSPSYELYERIRDYANLEIAGSLKFAGQFEEFEY